MTVETPCYVTREQIMSLADVKYTAYMRDQIEEAIEAGSRAADEFCRRVFYPVVATKYFDWPDDQYGPSWRFWIDDPAQLISVSSMTSGGVTIPSTDYFLEPVNLGPPYNRVEIDLDSASAFSSAGTHQRQTVIVGEWGFQHTHVTITTAAEGINASETTIDLNSSARVGCGALFEIDSEHLLCTDMTFIDTGQNTSALTESDADDQITGITTGSIEAGETLLIGSERLLVVDVAVGATDTLTVNRAVDGTALAAHSLNADIYAPRRMTMTRGAFGTTAASHLNSAPVKLITYPALVRKLARAYALDQLQQEGSAYARVTGAGDNEREATGRAIAALEKQVMKSGLARRISTGAI